MLARFAGILFSHPADFTPVCTTELGTVAKYVEEFNKRNIKLCAISCDDVDSHVEWIKDICASQGCAELGFPIIADPSRELITMLGMIGALGPPLALCCRLQFSAKSQLALDQQRRVSDALALRADPEERNAAGLPMPARAVRVPCFPPLMPGSPPLMPAYIIHEATSC